MDHIPRLSEAMYVGLCRKIGSPTIVRMRREVMDTSEVMSQPKYLMRGMDRMRSGSRREGFRLRNSDVDCMFWPPDHKVICDLSQVNLYSISRHTVILMECDDLPPGFTRLNLMSPSNDENVRSSRVVIDNNVYISSTLFRENYLRFLQNSDVTSCSIPHGPCSTFCTDEIETDFAFCFRSHHWPEIALPWIHRCRQQGWPSEVVISDILSTGFHVVPIGSTPESRLEWRISFSLAEQKLVYAMNHCQFLCYGLFKIFLKEVINFNNDLPVLCSYFTKTAVLWLIQTNNVLNWTPENLLPWFWKCFKLLIYWVYIGKCPNFFIPQNNMFQYKVSGSVRALVFNQLYVFYCKGIPSLLLSKTFSPFFSNVILNRALKMRTNESSIITSTKLDISLFDELRECQITISNVGEFAALIKKIEIEISERLTSYKNITIQCITSEILRNTAMFIQCCVYPNTNRNKVYYRAKKVTLLLKLSCTLGCASDILYLVMHLYRTCRYEHSLSYLQKAHDRMTRPYRVYSYHVNVDMYRHHTEGMSLGHKTRIALVKDITLYSQYTYIDELVLEQKISNVNGMSLLHIPPLVMLHMLFILNHFRLGDTVMTLQSIRDLQTLLLFDDGSYVPFFLRDISWQILGICQQICRDFPGARESYQHSLQQDPLHKIQEATVLRMNTLSQ